MLRTVLGLGISHGVYSRDMEQAVLKELCEIEGDDGSGRTGWNMGDSDGGARGSALYTRAR